MPVVNGKARVDFMIRIPCSLLNETNTEAAPIVLQYGHGLFGSMREVKDWHLSNLADRNKWILFATDWTGMSQYDVPAAIRIFGLDVSEFAAMPERTMQVKYLYCTSCAI